MEENESVDSIESELNLSLGNSSEDTRKNLNVEFTGNSFSKREDENMCHDLIENIESNLFYDKYTPEKNENKSNLTDTNKHKSALACSDYTEDSIIKNFKVYFNKGASLRIKNFQNNKDESNTNMTNTNSKEENKEEKSRIYYTNPNDNEIENIKLEENNKNLITSESSLPKIESFKINELIHDSENKTNKNNSIRVKQPDQDENETSYNEFEDDDFDNLSITETPRIDLPVRKEIEKNNEIRTDCHIENISAPIMNDLITSSVINTLNDDPLPVDFNTFKPLIKDDSVQVQINNNKPSIPLINNTHMEQTIINNNFNININLSDKNNDETDEIIKRLSNKLRINSRVENVNSFSRSPTKMFAINEEIYDEKENETITSDIYLKSFNKTENAKLSIASTYSNKEEQIIEINSCNNKAEELRSRIKRSILEKLTQDDSQNEEQDKEEDEEENILTEESKSKTESFDSIEEYDSEEEYDEVVDLNEGDFNGSFLKEMLIETNRQFIKDKHSNEDRIKEASSIVLFDIISLKIKAIHIYSFLKIQSFSSNKKKDLIKPLQNCYKILLYRRKDLLRNYFLKFRNFNIYLKNEENILLTKKFSSIINELGIGCEMENFANNSDVIKAIYDKLNIYYNKNDSKKQVLIISDKNIEINYLCNSINEKEIDPNIPKVPQVPLILSIPNVPLKTDFSKIPEIPNLLIKINSDLPKNVPSVPNGSISGSNIPSIPKIIPLIPNLQNGVPKIPINVPGVRGVPGVPVGLSLPKVPLLSIPGIPSLPKLNGAPSVPGLPKAPSVPRIVDKPGHIFPTITLNQPLPIKILPKPPKDTNPKKIFWNMIPKNKLPLTFWAKERSDAKVDYDSLCKYFCEAKKKVDIEANNEEAKKSENSNNINTIVKILDDKRLMNLAIVLSQVKFSNELMKNAIEDFNEEKLTLDLIEKIIPIAPNAEEIDKLKAFTGDLNTISNGEKFCFMLAGIYKFMTKLECIKYKKMIFFEKEEIITKLKILKEGIISIKGSPNFLKILKLILNIGNYLNADTAKGNAQGITVNTIALLDSIKGIGKEKYTLLDFLVINIKSKEPSLINFYKDFSNLQEVMKNDLADAESKIKEFETGLKKLQKEKDNLEKETNQESNKKFLLYLTELELIACEKLDEIFNTQDILNKEIEDAATMFGEDIKQFKLSEFFKMINDFVENFKKTANKLSAEEAKQLKKQIKEEKNKNIDNKNKYNKDLEKIRKTVVKKTLARKTALKNFNLDKVREIVKNEEPKQNNISNSLSPNMMIKHERISDKNEKRILEKLGTIEEIGKYSKSPILINKKNLGYDTPTIPELIKETKERVTKARMTRSRITKFKKPVYDHDEDNDSCDDLIENDFLKINKPLRISKLAVLDSSHKNEFKPKK